MVNIMIVTIFCVFFLGTATAQEIAKKQWIDHVSTALPIMMCEAGTYFRECFRVSQQKSMEIALSKTRICLKENSGKIPDSLRQPKDGARWGKIVGACAGERYEITLKEKRINSAQCNNPTNWVQ